MANEYEGRNYPVFPLPDTVMRRWETPEHGGPHVDVQLSGKGGGFVKDYVHSREPAFKELAADPASCTVMGYHTGNQLFAFDHLARHYLVCDRWFSSVRGATMPNRLYWVCGTSGGQRSNKQLFGVDFPLYHYPAFTRRLDQFDVSWRWYRPSKLIPPTLKLFDPKYLGEADRFPSLRHFAEDAKTGQLANV